MNQGRLMEAAHAAGVIVSYDLNFRSKLWSSAKAIAVIKSFGYELP